MPPRPTSRTIRYRPMHSGFSTSSFNPALSCAALNGTVTVTAAGTDGHGDPVDVTCTASVANDTDAPEYTSFPDDQSLECSGDTSISANGSPTAMDACGGVSIASSDSTVASRGNTETITRTWTASDSCGNSTSADQSITVQDTTSPNIACPADPTLECPADTSVAANGSATGSDNCDATPGFGSSDSTVFGDGDTKTITRTWTVTDACGNSSSCDQVITVDDTTAPELTCSATLVSGDDDDGDDSGWMVNS